MSAIETGVRRMGAEQEMFLVDQHLRPAPIATWSFWHGLDDRRLTTEIARFNLEANLTPQPDLRQLLCAAWSRS